MASFVKEKKQGPLSRKLLQQRTANSWIQAARYAVVGGVATVADVAVFGLLVYLGQVDYRLAVVGSYTVGTLVNFSLCNLWVFDAKHIPLLLAYVKHFVSGLLGLAVNGLVLVVLVEWFYFDQLLVAKIIASGLAFVVNFLLKKYYVYGTATKGYSQTDLR
ncbi:MAG: GtrA family protein [Candidatus Competibacterales bacterium]